MCMDYHKLNLIMVWDTFPFPRIDKALQAIHSSNWFLSFSLSQGYHELVMEESDIKRQHLEPVQCIYMSSFWLSNAGSSFCHLVKQCFGNQQFVTLLLYLNDICIFAPTIGDMLHHIELAFNRLKQFNLKIKPKKWQFFSTSVLFLANVLSAEGISVNAEEVDKVKTWPVPNNIKEVKSFLGLASYYRWFIPHFAKKAQCLHELVSPTANKPKKEVRTKANEIAPKTWTETF